MTDFTAIASAILTTDWKGVKLSPEERFVVHQVTTSGALSHNQATVKSALSALRKANHG